MTHDPHLNCSPAAQTSQFSSNLDAHILELQKDTRGGVYVQAWGVYKQRRGVAGGGMGCVHAEAWGVRSRRRGVCAGRAPGCVQTKAWGVCRQWCAMWAGGGVGCVQAEVLDV